MRCNCTPQSHPAVGLAVVGPKIVPVCKADSETYKFAGTGGMNDATLERYQSETRGLAVERAS